MKLHPDIARFLYFCIQAIRKEPVREELRKLDAEFYCSQQDIQDRVWQRGQETLLFALKHVAYYRENCSSKKLFEKVSTIKNYQDFIDVLMEFPIIDKQTFIKNKQQFQSDLSPSIRGYKTYSSGSTGEPVTFIRDQVDWARSHANLIKILELHGVRFGEPHIYFWGGDWTKTATVANSLKNFIFNRIKIGGHNKSLNELGLQVEKIRKYKPCYLYSVPSCLERICLYVQSVGENFHDLGLHCIFTSGENLKNESKKMIEDVFGTSVCDIYGCSEVGLIAFDCPEGVKHSLIDTNYIEIKSDGAIIVTNFFQRKYIVIRYRVGDLCTQRLSWLNCDCGLSYPVIGEISGRDTKDIILPNGIKFNSLSVAYIFDKVIFDASIFEGRFVLNERADMVLLLVPGPNFSSQTVEILKKEANSLFNMRIKVEIVDTIPPVRSGKKVDFISEWKP